MPRVFDNGRELHSPGYGRVGGRRSYGVTVPPYIRRGASAAAAPYYIKRYEDELKAISDAMRGNIVPFLKWSTGSNVQKFIDKGFSDIGLDNKYTRGASDATRRWLDWERGQFDKLYQGAKKWEFPKLGSPRNDGPKLIEGPGLSKRVRVTNPNSPMQRIGFKRKYSYRTTGHYGGQFEKKPLKKKASSAANLGVVLKGEKNATVTDAAAVYVGHNSCPIIPVLRALGWSIARLVAKRMNQDFCSFYTSINMPKSTASGSLRVTIQYRTNPQGVLTDFSWVHTNATWADLGDNIMGHILALCTDSLLYFEIVRMKFAQGDAALAEALPTVVLHGANLKIALNGFSLLKVQNNTVSASGDTAASEPSDDIANNPLVGKMFTGKGQSHQFKFNNDFTTSVPYIHYSVETGHATLIPSTATSIETAMSNAFVKVPNHKALTGILGYSNVKLMPGQIKTSTVKSFYKMTLNGWIRFLFPFIRNAGNLTAFASFGAASASMKIGKNRLIGLEHMLHSGTEPDIVISYQIDYTISAIATHKKKMYCNADYQTSINTLIVGA